MRVSEALRIIQEAQPDARPFEALVACGCTPLHLKTLLHAHLQQRLPQQRVRVAEGLYGDLAGTLERAGNQPLHAVAIVLEWSDLDLRLGYRSAARWGTTAATDIPRCAAATLDRIAAAIEMLDRGIRVALSLPVLPLPPMFLNCGTQMSETELELASLLALFASRVARRSGLAVVNRSYVGEKSFPGDWLDLKSDLLIGFPYTMGAADALAGTCAGLLVVVPPRKGIITDLDDTLWNGIVGEVGAQGVSWDLGRRTHLHALYQNLLGSLAEQGVLVAVASKNDPGVVKEVFDRADLLLPAARVFPFEVHWQAKSGSVKRILETWNIGPDDAIFIDDSPMELAEVEAAHPGIRCLRFPRGDYAACFDLLRQVRDLCGKEQLTIEDTLRLDSIRQGVEFRQMAADGSVTDTFLEKAEAVVTFDFSPSSSDPRVLELVNKTNQFNLNGIRWKEPDWRHETSAPGALVAVVTYDDKFGPLGKIAVLQGSIRGTALWVKAWVMSCRAFSRRVEHQCLRLLFDRFALSEIHFDFASTARNGPLQEFLGSLWGARPAGPVTLSRADFDARCPALFHHVAISGGQDEDNTWTN